jgi:hypothetical protein
MIGVRIANPAHHFSPSNDIGTSNRRAKGANMQHPRLGMRDGA